MLIPKVIKIDFNEPESTKVHRIRAVQGDCYSRCIYADLEVDGMPWTSPENIICALRYSKPDGTNGSYDTLPNGEPAWNLSGNRLIMHLAPQMFTAAGCVTSQVMLIEGETILYSFDFQLDVAWDPSRTSLSSEDYFNWHHWMELHMKEMLELAQNSGAFVGPPPNLTIGTVTTLPPGSMATASLRGTASDPILDFGIPQGILNVDPTLSLEGLAADAAVTGAALAMKAPSGYGLGQVAFLDENVDIDTIMSSGWYSFSSSNTSKNLPFSGGELFVIQRTDNHCTQVAFQALGANVSIKIRKTLDGVFSPWEWVNPPLEPDTEYRTIERYAGKPVYIRLVSCGAFPSAGTAKTISIAESGVIQTVLSAIGHTSDGHVFPTDSFSGTSGTVSISSIQTAISIYCSGNWTSWEKTYVLIKYIKYVD